MKMNSTAAVFLALLTALFVSCAARISGGLDAGSAGNFTISASLQPRMSALIRSLQALGGDVRPDSPILDGRAIAQSMSAAPGVSSVSFRNTAPGSIEGPVQISKIGDFLAGGGRTGGFISFEQQAGTGRCAINISRESGPEILSFISPEIADYLSVLMAPLATGEELTKTDYVMLVSSIYGRGIADEISGSTIRASIDFPGPVQSVKGGTFSGRRAEFAIPLVDLLVLENPLSYEITWSQ
ncbi:MAG: hypothetical protein LBH97_07655 [Treponema sp.]|jgi:hypothetical protein|nr:hypothetical protein [Treponema sp.]